VNAPFPLSTESLSIVDLHDPSEAARIEGFVAEAAGALPFHRPAWLLAVEQGTGQRATGIVAEKSGVVTGWLPLTEVHSPLFGRALVSSGFAVGGGALAERESTAERLCAMAADLAVRRSCPTVELRGGHLPDGWDRIEGKHCNFAADLAGDAEQQLLAIPRKQRAEVRKGLKNAMQISVGRSAENLAAHYAVYAESVRNLGTPVFPRALFSAMLQYFADEADLLTVRHEGVPVASVLSFYHRGTVMPFWGGGSRAARHLRANEVMYYELMCHALRRGCNRFDFGRSKTGSGPYNFKKNWGFEPEPLVYASWTAPGETKRDIDPTSDSYSARIELWKRLPLSVANRLGPHIAKGLA
jgi:FemAB-related protein (PEP-CTERM system-associated)